jgi:RHS repeat-associated protein
MYQIIGIKPLPYPNPDLCNLFGNGHEPALFFYHPDHLGSTGMVTDNNATVTQGFLYTPFGELLYEYSPGWQSGVIPKYSFNAKELDEENGMYYYSARYYAPPTFISRDPLFEKYPSISPYAYCANNPIILVDPTGMELGDPLKTMRVRRDATYHTFGYVRPYTKSGIHQGIDYYAPEGTPIIMVPFFRTTK